MKHEDDGDDVIVDHGGDNDDDGVNGDSDG